MIQACSPCSVSCLMASCARAAATVAELLSVVRARAARRGLPGLGVRAGFLDHCAPSLPQALGSLEDRASPSAVVVPLLLTAAYHSKTDIPRVLGRLSGEFPQLRVGYGATLGPHPLLFSALGSAFVAPELSTIVISSSVNEEITPDVVILPMESPLVNHRAPSGPATIEFGPLTVGAVKVVTEPDVVIRPIEGPGAM